MGDREESTSDDHREPLSPTARLFHAPKFNCHIIAIMGCKTTIDPGVMKAGLEHTLIKHPRFSSKLTIVADNCRRRKMQWERATVNLDNHVIVPDLDPRMDSPDQFVEQYVSHLTTIPMDLSKPLWELHILNVKTSDAEAVWVLRLHHSMGDGASLMSLVLACARQTSDPEALPIVPVLQRAGLEIPAGFWWFFLAIWTMLRIVWNTLVDLALFVATIFFLKDTNTPIKGCSGVELKPKRLVHRTVSLDDIKLVKNAMNVTINDVVVGATQAGISKYLDSQYGRPSDREKDGNPRQEKYNLPKGVRLRATIIVNIRPTPGICKLAELMSRGSKAKWGWGNRIGYIVLPFSIALQGDPLDYIRIAKARIDRKKLSLEAISTYTTAQLVDKTLGTQVAGAIAHKALFNTTLTLSNMVGPLEEISLYGHPIAYIAPSVYGHPHAVTIHFQSYCNKMTIALAVDPEVIPDPHSLLDGLEESLNAMRIALVARGLDAA